MHSITKYFLHICASPKITDYIDMQNTCNDTFFYRLKIYFIKEIKNKLKKYFKYNYVYFIFIVVYI